MRNEIPEIGDRRAKYSIWIVRIKNSQNLLNIQNEVFKRKQSLH